MKTLLIVVTVAIVMTFVILLSLYIGSIIWMTLFLALIYDALDNGVIDEEEIQSYSPDVTNIKDIYEEIMQIMLKEHILIKVLICNFKFKLKK